MSEVLLTPQEIRKLKRMCKDPMLELGMMMRPEHMQCFKEKAVIRHQTHTIVFEKHDDAAKWNTMHRKAILRNGHIATIAIGGAVGFLTRDWKIAWIAGAGASIVKDEIQDDIWFPEMFEGWSLTRNYTFKYIQFPRQHLYMWWTDVIHDQNGKERDRYKYGMHSIKIGEPYGIPEKVVHNMMVQLPKTRTTRFK